MLPVCCPCAARVLPVLQVMETICVPEDSRSAAHTNGFFKVPSNPQMAPANATSPPAQMASRRSFQEAQYASPVSAQVHSPPPSATAAVPRADSGSKVGLVTPPPAPLPVSQVVAPRLPPQAAGKATVMDQSSRSSLPSTPDPPLASSVQGLSSELTTGNPVGITTATIAAQDRDRESISTPSAPAAAIAASVQPPPVPV